MKQNKETVNQRSIRRITLALFIGIILMIGSFGFIYWTSLSSQNQVMPVCDSGGQSFSHDGLVVAEDADLTCVGKFEKLKSAKEAKEVIGLSFVAISSLFSLVLVAILLNKTR